MNDDPNKDNDADNSRIKNRKATISKCFDYKTKVIGSTSDDNNILEVEVVVPLKYLSNFWRSLDLPLINCEIELDLSCSKNCAISEISRTPEMLGANSAETTTTTSAISQINNAKRHVPVVTLSINNNIKLLENMKQRFKRTISCKKYKSKITSQPKNNNLDFMIDPKFRNINSSFVISFKNGNVDPMRNSFDKYYMSLV